jgi:hypothetical protein
VVPISLDLVLLDRLDDSFVIPVVAGDDCRMLILIVGDGSPEGDYDDDDGGDGGGDDVTVVAVVTVAAVVGYRGIIGRLLNLNEEVVVMVVAVEVAVVLVETVEPGNIDLEIRSEHIAVVSRKNRLHLHTLFVAKLAS